jgi:hypothetical protein
MTDESFAAWQVATDCEDVVSIPMDVSDAAYHGRYSNEHIATLAPIGGNTIDRSQRWTVYLICDTGAIVRLANDRGALAAPVGRIETMIDTVCTETDYVVTNVGDTEYYGNGDSA